MRASLLLFLLISCTPLEPDPVIRDGVDIGPIQSFEAERVEIKSGMGSMSDPTASDNHYLGLYSTISVPVPLELLTEVSGMVIRARGDQCKGGPELEVKVDGEVKYLGEIKATKWTDYNIPAHLMPGMHDFVFRFTNDKFDGPNCDRNLFLDKVTFINARSVPKGSLPAASLLPASGTHVIDDPLVKGGKALAFMSEASALGIIQTDAAGGLSIRARGDQCKGPPEITLTVDGIDRGWFQIPSTTWADYAAPVPLAPGEHTVSIAFINDKYEGGCDRNAYVADITAIPNTPPAIPLAPPVAPPPTSVVALPTSATVSLPTNVPMSRSRPPPPPGAGPPHGGQP